MKLFSTASGHQFPKFVPKRILGPPAQKLFSLIIEFATFYFSVFYCYSYTTRRTKYCCRMSLVRSFFFHHGKIVVIK